MGWREDKEERKRYYLKYVYGWKQRPCSACGGTGYYDNTGSPKCAACEGTGKERYKSDLFLENIKKRYGIVTYEEAKKAWENGKTVCCYLDDISHLGLTVEYEPRGPEMKDSVVGYEPSYRQIVLGNWYIKN